MIEATHIRGREQKQVELIGRWIVKLVPYNTVVTSNAVNMGLKDMGINDSSECS